MINRREALSRVAIIMGGTVLGAEAFLTGCKTNTKGVKFSQEDIDFLNEILGSESTNFDTPTKEQFLTKFKLCFSEDFCGANIQDKLKFQSQSP